MGKCVVCKIVGLLAGIGALNWGLVALFKLNLVSRLLGMGTTGEKIAYIVVGLAGLVVLIALVKPCSCTKKAQ